MDIAGTDKKDDLSYRFIYSEDTLVKILENFIDIDNVINIKIERLVKLIDEIGGITYCSAKVYTTTHALIQDDYNDVSKKKLYARKCQELNGIETLTVCSWKKCFCWKR